MNDNREINFIELAFLETRRENLPDCYYVLFAFCAAVCRRSLSNYQGRQLGVNKATGIYPFRDSVVSSI